MDHEPDPNKQPADCKAFGEDYYRKCRNMKETEASKRSFDGERYSCEVCGAGYYLDYDEMR